MNNLEYTINHPKIRQWLRPLFNKASDELSMFSHFYQDTLHRISNTVKDDFDTYIWSRLDPTTQAQIEYGFQHNKDNPFIRVPIIIFCLNPIEPYTWPMGIMMIRRDFDRARQAYDRAQIPARIVSARFHAVVDESAPEAICPSVLSAPPPYYYPFSFGDDGVIDANGELKDVDGQYYDAANQNRNARLAAGDGASQTSSELAAREPS